MHYVVFVIYDFAAVVVLALEWQRIQNSGFDRTEGNQIGRSTSRYDATKFLFLISLFHAIATIYSMAFTTLNWSHWEPITQNARKAIDNLI